MASLLKSVRAPPLHQTDEGQIVVDDQGVDPQKALVDDRTPEEIKEERRYGQYTRTRVPLSSSLLRVHDSRSGR